MANKTQSFVHCIYCKQEYEAGNVGAAPADIRNERHRMETHIRECKFVPGSKKVQNDPQALSGGREALQSLSAQSSSSSSKRPRQQSMLQYVPKPVIDQCKVQFQSLLVECMAENNRPESFVETESFNRLIEFCNPQAAHALPCRELLGGRILSEYAAKADDASKRDIKTLVPAESYKRVKFLSRARRANFIAREGAYLRRIRMWQPSRWARQC
jgi:hypothetical protein